jgi:hypothetical protein
LFVILATHRASADTVVLINGTRLKGTVKVQELGKYVVLELPGGAQRTIMWADLKSVEIDAPGKTGGAPPAAPGGSSSSAPPAPPPPPPPPPAQPAAPMPDNPKFKKRITRAEFDAAAAPLPAASARATPEAPPASPALPPTATPGSSPSPRPPCADGTEGCRKEANATLDHGVPRLTGKVTEDCAKDENEVCKKTSTLDAGENGLAISVSKESATRVVGPRSSAGNLGVSVGLVFGSAKGATILGANVGGSYRGIVGGKFPGEEGGSWGGIFVEPKAEVTLLTQNQKSLSASALVGTSAGFQWMKFGAMDQATLQQHGWGLAAGGQVGALIPLSDGKTSTTYGAAINILRPKYNQGTGAYSVQQFNLFVLPLPGMFFLIVGYQGNFG